MNFISATRIHDGRQWLPEGSVLQIAEDGTIVAIHQKGILPAEKTHFYEGVLCPGFVNAHCHIELSHMKGVIEEGKQLVPFLQGVMTGRNGFTTEQKDLAITKAIGTMKQNGIVAAGDIANGTDTLNYRQEAGFHIHTFIESLGFTETNTESRFAYAEQVYRQFADQKEGQYLLRQSIVPHAPYSVSGKLLSLINAFDPYALLSVHNQETQAENEFYQSKTGNMFDLYRTLNIDASFFTASGKTSLQTYLPQLHPTHPMLLVHNTFMGQDDIDYLKASGFAYYLCLCPNANWYIERRMPPVMMFLANNMPVCLGTDSLASNHELSIWSEVKMLQQHFPQIALEQLLTWATYNGAKALQMEDRIGSLEPGKRPGIVHIDKDDKIKAIF